MQQDELTYDGPIKSVDGARDDRQIAQVLNVLGEALGPDLIGVYLYGSSIFGGLHRDSDLDLFAVTRRATTPEEKKVLVARLLTISLSTTLGSGRPIELTIVEQSRVRPWTYPPRFDFVYGDWLRGEFERGNTEPWETTESIDLASLITMVRLANAPLVGPPPAEVLDRVPRADYMRATVDDIGRLVGYLDGDTRNVLLTLARIWSTAATGAIRSKDRAADWALERLPPEHRPVLARARALYLGELATQEDRWDDVGPRVRACVDEMADRIAHVAVDSIMMIDNSTGSSPACRPDPLPGVTAAMSRQEGW